MGSFLDKPIEDKQDSENKTGEGLIAGHTCMQGWRVDMEDAHALEPRVDDGLSFFMVLDGHGGDMVSKRASSEMLTFIRNTEEFKQAASASFDPEVLGVALTRGALNLDAEFKKIPEVQTGEDHSGSTCVMGFVTKTHVVMANIGDSRFILCSNGGVAMASADHKPYDAKEQTRIEKAGGTVTMRRVNGDLAVSRALGDFNYKRSDGLPDVEQQVSAEADIYTWERNSAADEFLCLCCDGIWDVMENEMVCKFVQRHLARMTKEEARRPCDGNKSDEIHGMAKICEKLIDRCLYKGSRDNMTAMVVAFEGAKIGSMTDMAMSDDEKDMNAKRAQEGSAQ